ncbi:serologically defined colon cancer antigen 8 isoform X8 [Acinonyx jubatus]|uniref:Serologically defined colon cancer antigen 8 isoform X8 n=1 Tax=Acinonyx jubatus TaxID=32536 RepID=A0ABM3P0S4_ACIJB|nr:serologically defined colon cancer antigen 8 isoform X8 [Acinonyx jubatus]
MRANGWEGPPASSDRDSMLPSDSSGRKLAGATPAPRPLVPRRATSDISLRNSHLWAPSLCMAKSPENSTLEEILGQYQRSLRERANRSIHQLKCALREGDVTVGEDAAGPSVENEENEENEDAGTAWHELRHSHAVNQLKALLRQQATKESEVSPSRRQKVSPLLASEDEEANVPTIHNLVPIINDQSQYIHHLEAEVKFCKEELSGMKNRVQVVVLENESLQQELKSQRQEEAMREQTLLDASGNMQNSWITTGEDSGVGEAAKRRFSHGNADIVIGASAGEAEKLKPELERLKLTYEEKTEVLESQLKFLRERDDLMSALVSVRSILTDVQEREAGAYEQVKQAVQVAEEANFEKTKALIQCEQLKNELERQKERLEKELASQQEKRAFEKEMMKKDLTKEKEDLGSKILSLSQNIAQLEVQVEKVTREKISAINQLEEIQNQLASKEMDVTKVCGEMRYQLNKTKMEKDEAEKEHREYRAKTKRDLEMKDQEIEKLRLEVSESKQHLEREQQKAAGAREECLQLTDLLSESQHQLHLTRISQICLFPLDRLYENVSVLCPAVLQIFSHPREGLALRLEKDSIQQRLSNEAKAQALQAQQREQELTQKIQQMEAQHDKTENEQYSLLTSQNTFLTKLKEECCALAKKLEQISQKSRSEIAQLSQEKRYTYDKLEKLQRRNDELEKQCVQHGRLHEIMKQRLKQLDKHSQATALQLVQLLNKQNQLLLERQSLQEEVGRLIPHTAHLVASVLLRWAGHKSINRPGLRGPAAKVQISALYHLGYPACHNLIADLDETE